MDLTVSSAAERAANLERIVDAYYRRDPVEEANSEDGRAVDAHNQWVDASTAKLQAGSDDLSQRLARIRELEGRIHTLDAGLDREKAAQDTAAAGRFNALVAERKALIPQHAALAHDFEERQRAYGQAVEAHNSEAGRRQAALEEMRKEARQRIDSYRAWLAGRSDERFFQELNGLYASLCGQARAGGGNAERNAILAQVRTLRADVAAWAIRRQEKADNGVLILSALIVGAAEVFLTVDTGAQLVTLTPELVEAVGLTGRIGEEIDLTLAGGLRTRGRKLTLPSMSVMGMQADDVEAVVLAESQVGVDGLLGLSYLNRFDYEVVRERPQRLRLIPRSGAAAPPAAPGYDVFICHSTKDAWWSHVVFDALSLEGYRPFLSEVSLPQEGDAEFRKRIDAALGSARHMVVVASCAGNLSSPWVEAEWGLFLTQKRAGRKQGNIITVRCGDMQIDDLPTGLSPYQSVPIADLNWRMALKDYLPR